EQIGVTVDCRAVADRIGAGLREHRSQHHVMSDDPDNSEQWDKRIKDEWHVVAWPTPEPGAPMLTDLFDGLP
ncbi:MAG: N-acetylglucosamine malate deacetylase 2, partial [Nocardioidaceae bacterium]|nr:N-acetylglucosamine malate deacetylase 2 [Nocardioidaceae bacterium]